MKFIIQQFVVKLSQYIKYHQIFFFKNKLYQYFDICDRVKFIYSDNFIILVVSKIDLVIENIELIFQKYFQINIDIQLILDQILYIYILILQSMLF